MFREMRRKKQALSMEECVSILEKSTSGVLAVSGDDGYPYAVPLSYVYHDGHLYFHGALTGHRADSIRRCDKVSFCVVAQDRVVPEAFTTHYISVIAFGRARILEDPQEKRAALLLLADRYGRDFPQQRDREIAQEFDRVCMIDMTVEHLTGKQAIELVARP